MGQRSEPSVTKTGEVFMGSAACAPPDDFVAVRSDILGTMIFPLLAREPITAREVRLPLPNMRER